MKTRLDRRRRILTLLNQAVFRWHPALVDAALEHSSIPDDLKSLVASKEFQDRCKETLARMPSLASRLGDLLNPRFESLEPFYRSVLRRAVAGWTLTAEQREELFERIRFEHLRHVHSYMPGAIAPDGEVHFYGFKAYLEQRVPYIAAAHFRKMLSVARRHESFNEKLDFLPEPQTKIRFDKSAVSEAILQTVTSSYDAELLWFCVSRNATLEQCSEHLGWSGAKVHGDLARIFEGIGRRLDVTRHASPNVLACRKALSDLIAREELADLLGLNLDPSRK
jgi:hypothetical protein